MRVSFFAGSAGKMFGGAVIGALLGIVVSVPFEFKTEAKRNIRIAMGLPKFWVPVPGPGSAKDHVKAECPSPESTITIVTGGQSNAANSNTRKYSSTNGRVFTWFDNSCYISRDPVLGATGSRGSLWVAMGDAMAERAGKNILLINGAVGGTQVADWLDPRSGYVAALQRRIESAEALGYKPALTFWHQGETDAAANDVDTFTVELTELVHRLLDITDESIFYMFRASKCQGYRRAEGVAEFIAAQTTVAKVDQRIIPGMNTDQLDHDYRTDSCHFNSFARSVIVDQVMRDLEPVLSDMLAPKPFRLSTADVSYDTSRAYSLTYQVTPPRTPAVSPAGTFP